MPLSYAAVKTALPRDAAYRLTDEKGLYLLVQPGGAKWWRFDYRHDGKRKTLSMGVWPDTSIADARTHRDRARELVARGVDPSQARREAAEVGQTLRAVALEWHGARSPDWSDQHAATILRRLERNVFPALGDKPVADVAKPDVLKVIRAIEDRGAVPAARRVKSYIEGLFGFAADAGYLGDAVSLPTDGLDRVLKAKPKSRSRAKVAAGSMGHLLAKMGDSDEELVTKQAMRLTMLTVVRTVEMRFARVEEGEGLDGPAPLWRIPAARMKMEQEHLVPLSRQAAALWQEIAGERKAGLLFPRSTASGTISSNTMLYALYRLGYHGRATVHGFRGTFSTWANEAGFNRDWVERALAHQEGGVRAAYNSAQYLTGRRDMLQIWANFLDEQEYVARVIG